MKKIRLITTIDFEITDIDEFMKDEGCETIADLKVVLKSQFRKNPDEFLESFSWKEYSNPLFDVIDVSDKEEVK